MSATACAVGGRLETSATADADSAPRMSTPARAPNRSAHWMQDLPASEIRASERAPNIIFILAGDFSINDLSVFGGGVTNGWVPTPNIDSEHDEAEEVSGAVQFKMESTPLHGACPKRFPPVSERECGTC